MIKLIKGILMNKNELLKKIEELENRIEKLENKPPVETNLIPLDIPEWEISPDVTGTPNRYFREPSMTGEPWP